jgi:hypothetical protein
MRNFEACNLVLSMIPHIATAASVESLSNIPFHALASTNEKKQRLCLNSTSQSTSRELLASWPATLVALRPPRTSAASLAAPLAASHLTTLALESVSGPLGALLQGLLVGFDQTAGFVA